MLSSTDDANKGDPMAELWLGQPIWMWVGFMGVVLALLVLDLGVLNRRDHEIGVRESLTMSAMYIAIALAFGGFVWWRLGSESGLEYVTGFFIEKSLAMDNVFVIALIFSAFSIPRIYQHRVLFWGILGVIVLRAGLHRLGYALQPGGEYDAATRATVEAFQRHWRPGQVDGIADGETRATLMGVLQLATAESTTGVLN